MRNTKHLERRLASPSNRLPAPHNGSLLSSRSSCGCSSRTRGFLLPNSVLRHSSQLEAAPAALSLIPLGIESLLDGFRRGLSVLSHQIAPRHAQCLGCCAYGTFVAGFARKTCDVSLQLSSTTTYRAHRLRATARGMSCLQVTNNTIVRSASLKYFSIIAPYS